MIHDDQWREWTWDIYQFNYHLDHGPRIPEPSSFRPIKNHGWQGTPTGSWRLGTLPSELGTKWTWGQPGPPGHEEAVLQEDRWLLPRQQRHQEPVCGIQPVGRQQDSGPRQDHSNAPAQEIPPPHPPRPSRQHNRPLAAHPQTSLAGTQTLPVQLAAGRLHISIQLQPFLSARTESYHAES